MKPGKRNENYRIPYEEIEQIHGMFGVSHLYALRDKTWQVIESSRARRRLLDEEVTKLFVARMVFARDNKLLCYYENGGNNLCRGYVSEIVNLSADNLRVKMTDADHSRTGRPSGFDKYDLPYHSILHIVDEPIADTQSKVLSASARFEMVAKKRDSTATLFWIDNEKTWGAHDYATRYVFSRDASSEHCYIEGADWVNVHLLQ